MKSRLVRRLHVTHEKRNLRKHYTALRFNAGGTADSEDDIRPGIQVCIPGRFFMFSGVKESIAVSYTHLTLPTIA